MIYLAHFVQHERKILSGSYITDRFMHDHHNWYGIRIFNNCPIYLCHLSANIHHCEYPIDLNCMLKFIIDSTLRSVQNQTLVVLFLFFFSILSLTFPKTITLTFVK